MPQSTKDSQGGKTHAKKTQHASGAVSDKAAKKSGRSSASPTGPLKHGEKKTTPR
ncbi:hypothetical protein [Ramlibacter sp. PS4R-6]|uniref:hypothetical protein n=1 Tax=Ramlibacter sp. PS4R-6 TaxID=3133438 RepID=UPI0030A87CC9